MKPVSFVELFRSGRYTQLVVPIIQRDYAQGREGGTAPSIREAFLAVLEQAITKGPPVGLDFVYGDRDARGALVPLDGQQRLTTLFLLHWYFAARARVPAAEAAFLEHFTYETRISSREFCARLAERVGERSPFPMAERLSAWIADQPFYVARWAHDPTIAAMLTMLDAIDDRFKGADCEKAWGRLTDRNAPAVSFHVLDIENLGLTDDLYIKMNSRGKPLTRFEQFKARFEAVVEEASPDHYRQFIDKVDNAWSDLLWELRGEDNLIDDEFLGLFRFVTDVINQRAGRPVPDALLERDLDEAAALLYGKANPRCREHLDELFRALDCWPRGQGKGAVAKLFADLFVQRGHAPGRVAVFDREIDLFALCCRSYGSTTGAFSLRDGLLLFAVLTHRIHATTDFPRRVRTLRNLLEASVNEIRAEKMPALLRQTESLIRDGDLAALADFNTHQIAEERTKESFRSDHPEKAAALDRFEDHPLLRGTVSVVGLDPSRVEADTASFWSCFPEAGGVRFVDVSGALLACSDYALEKTHGRYQFGSPTREGVWRALFTSVGAARFAGTQKAVRALLHELTTRAGTVHEKLRAVMDDFLTAREREGTFDWRYYLVRYEVARTGESGIYASDDGPMGFGLCMMRGERKNGYYRDPYICAAVTEAGHAPPDDGPWFIQYQERWVVLQGGCQLRFVPTGVALKPPTKAAFHEPFVRVLAAHAIDEVLPVLEVGAAPGTQGRVDRRDRIQLAARLIADLQAMRPS